MGILELVTVIVVLAIIGFAVWVVTEYVPMPPPFKMGIIVIVTLVVLLWVVRALVTGGSLLPAR